MTASLPHNREQITDGSGRATVPFRRFLEELSRQGVSVAAMADAVAALAVDGSGSVDVDGTPADGFIVRLVNDQAAPGDTRYYGTDTSGTKGWFEFPEADVAVPFLVPDGTTYTVAENKQALFALPIELEGDAVLVLDGALVEVD